ncbi:hypothetical protein [Salinispora arenicola]|uniref:hypothetical protein n=1 Tax=Salinispora arenicola TaxID=168697 RepID=UPI00168E6190|nr:hypothetical protein [Salinispora arenicola]NIL64666.1 hypothetical protein [Salinispora arenicola]
MHHGVEIDPPGLEHIDRDDKLRARELPSAQEFERALVRAQHLCTAKTNKVHSARNVKRLADEVRGWASAPAERPRRVGAAPERTRHHARDFAGCAQAGDRP